MQQTDSSSIETTACPLDCPDSCSISVTVDDGRVISLTGDQRNPVTGGFLCSKVRRFSRHLYGEDRIAQPAVRVGDKGEGRFEPLSWKDAIDLLANKLRDTVDRHGGEAVLPFSYGGSNGLLTQDTLDARLFRRLGTSRLARTVCAAPSTRAAVGLYGKMPGVAYEDFPHAKLLVVWGANPSASGIHLVPYIKAACDQGAKLVVIDPRRTPLAKQADLHLALRPGTDLPLALALISWLFDNGHADDDFLAEHTTGAQELRARASDWNLERAADECGLELADVESFARLYADISPALIRSGWGQERNRNGGSSTAAILALPAVAGKFGVRGGGYCASNSGAWSFDAEPIINQAEPATRKLNMNRLGRDLLDATDPIHLLFVYNANPLATLPRQDLVQQGLERDDLFTVVFDQVMTDTALYADLVLPATTFLEHQDIRPGYGAYATQQVRPVIEPVGEARSNQHVFAALLERLDLVRDGDITADDLFAAFTEQSALDRDQQQALRDKGLAEPPTGTRPIQMVDALPRTADGKIHLLPPDLDAESTHGLYRYQPDPKTESAPLALISPGTRHTISSTFGQLLKGPATMAMHPDDAAARDLADGTSIRVWNDLGEVICRLRVTDDTRPGVVDLPKGLWCRHTDNGRTSNALVPDTYTDLAEGACFNDARVQVAAIAR